MRGLGQDRALGDRHEGAVVEEGGVEGRERPAGRARLAIEPGFDELGLPVEHVAQAADLHAVGRAHRGQRGRVPPVDEDDLVAVEGAAEQERSEVLGGGPIVRALGTPEGRARQRGHARMPPVLLPRGGEARLLEGGHGGRAQGAQPLRLLGGQAGAEGLVVLAIAEDLVRGPREPLRRLAHRAGASSHS